LRQRKLMLPAFHGERVEHYREIMRDATERAVASWPSGEAFALRPHTQAIAFEVIVRAVFGVDDAEAIARLREPLSKMLDWAGNPAPLLLVAVVGPDNPVVRRVIARRYLEPVDRELYALIAERRRARDLEEREDVLSTLLLARDEDGEPMTDVELRDELLTLLVAGHETTATSLAWALERLTRHDGALDRVAGDARYAAPPVKETLRLRPVGAIVLRRLLEPLAVAGHQLPAGTAGAPGHPAGPPPRGHLPRARRLPPGALPRRARGDVQLDPVRRRRAPVPGRGVSPGRDAGRARDHRPVGAPGAGRRARGRP